MYSVLVGLVLLCFTQLRLLRTNCAYVSFVQRFAVVCRLCGCLPKIQLLSGVCQLSRCKVSIVSRHGVFGVLDCFPRLSRCNCIYRVCIWTDKAALVARYHHLPNLVILWRFYRIAHPTRLHLAIAANPCSMTRHFVNGVRVFCVM